MSKITESARGEECQVRLPGICNRDNATVVWAHCNKMAAGKGKGLKALDPLGAYCCSDCHDVYDMRRLAPYISQFTGVRLSRIEVEHAFYEGMMRSFIKLVEKGLVKF